MESLPWGSLRGRVIWHIGSRASSRGPTYQRQDIPVRRISNRYLPMVDMADGSALSTDVGKIHPAQAQVCRSAPRRAGRAEPDYDYAVKSGTRGPLVSRASASSCYRAPFNSPFERVSRRNPSFMLSAGVPMPEAVWSAKEEDGCKEVRQRAISEFNPDRW